MKTRDQLLLEQAYININTTARLREMLNNDISSSVITEGFGEQIKQKLNSPQIPIIQDLENIKKLHKNRLLAFDFESEL